MNKRLVIMIIKQTNLTRRKRRVRQKLHWQSDRPRLSVFRSNKYLYGQIIDDKKGKTLVAVSEKELKGKDKKPKLEKAKLLGEMLAKKAVKVKIKQVVFDKGANLYHGRIKSFAEGARTGGLKF